MIYYPINMSYDQLNFFHSYNTIDNTKSCLRKRNVYMIEVVHFSTSYIFYSTKIFTLHYSFVSILLFLEINFFYNCILRKLILSQDENHQ